MKLSKSIWRARWARLHGLHSAVGIRHLAAASGKKSHVDLGWHNSASMEELRQSFIEQGFEIVPHDYTFVDCAATPSMILNELRAARTGAKETPARKAQTKPQRAAPSKQAQAKPQRAAPAKKKPKR